MDAFVDAVQRLYEMNRQACRQAVQNGFDIHVLTPFILDFLQILSRGEKLAKI